MAIEHNGSHRMAAADRSVAGAAGVKPLPFRIEIQAGAVAPALFLKKSQQLSSLWLDPAKFTSYDSANKRAPGRGTEHPRALRACAGRGFRRCAGVRGHSSGEARGPHQMDAGTQNWSLLCGPAAPFSMASIGSDMRPKAAQENALAFPARYQSRR